mmetsp:Transcript_794/g.1632  ORF Transcript_794/g.1632 Transcript_794/m.1632 type:complete len:229 (-) Transcript_794:646-1332(-)
MLRTLKAALPPRSNPPRPPPPSYPHLITVTRRAAAAKHLTSTRPSKSPLLACVRREEPPPPQPPLIAPCPPPPRPTPPSAPHPHPEGEAEEEAPREVAAAPDPQVAGALPPLTDLTHPSEVAPLPLPPNLHPLSSRPVLQDPTPSTGPPLSPRAGATTSTCLRSILATSSPPQRSLPPSRRYAVCAACHQPSSARPAAWPPTAARRTDLKRGADWGTSTRAAWPCRPL